MGLGRSFTIHKNGRLVEARCTGSDRFSAVAEHEPLPRDRIVGVDTESLRRDGELSTVLVPMWFSTGPEVLEVDRDGPRALDLMLGAVCERYSVPDSGPSRHVQREAREGFRRDGRREMVDPVLLVFFNLPYDIGRLCADHPQLLRALASGADTYRVWVGKREVEVSRMVLGAGSSFEWYVRERDGEGNPRITRMLAIDCSGYWKSTLRVAAKAAGVSEKLDAPFDFDRNFEDVEPDEWEAFVKYAAGDAQSTAELYEATVGLLRSVDRRVVKRTGVVPPSAPGAAARIAFAKVHDLHPDKKVWRRYPAWADQLGCDAYRGARALCARPGVHYEVKVWDIKSAYPYAMTLLPDPVMVRCDRVEDQSTTGSWWHNLRGKFGVLVVDGEGFDPVYPALRCHDENAGRLRGVYGRFRNLPVTVPEAVIGLTDGSLRIDRARDGVIMEGNPELSFLRHAMLDFFAIKDDPNNEPALQNMGKLMANSSYGKLIEVQCNQHWIDSDVMCPPFANLDHVALRFARLYAEVPAEEYDDRASEELERLLMHRADCEDSLCLGCGGEPLVDGPSIPLRLRMGRHRRYECGQYFMPLYAAQITGLTSASLGLMARCTNAIQGDTDSVHVKGDDAYGRSRFHETMAMAGYPWPTTGLGRWNLETPVPSEESLCARIKLYSHRLHDSPEVIDLRRRISSCSHEEDRKMPDGEVVLGRRSLRVKYDALKFKQARHGFSKYPGGAEELHEAIRDVVNGQRHAYYSKPSPRKIREALVRGLPVGEFISRLVTVNAGVDRNTVIADGVCRWKPLDEMSRYHE